MKFLCVSSCILLVFICFVCAESTTCQNQEVLSNGIPSEVDQPYQCPTIGPSFSEHKDIHVTAFSGRIVGFDIWNRATWLGQKTFVDHANKEIASAKRRYADVASKIDDLKHTFSAGIRGFVHHTKALKTHGLDVKEFSEKFAQEIDPIFTEFKEKFGDILRGDRGTEHYKELERAVDWTVDRIEEALVKVLSTFNVQEPSVKEKFGSVKPEMKRAAMLTIEVVDRHPRLMIILGLFMISLLITEGPIVYIFLQCVGFGALGPIKGSLAAWAQRYFFANAVAKGSWFAVLQAAGMASAPTTGLSGMILSAIGWLKP